jgi:hypothetical protein
MGLDHYVLDRKIRALRRTRDQLARMVHDGSANAKKRWADLEESWCDLGSQAKRLAPGIEDGLDGAADIVRESITELRKGYDDLASELWQPRAERLPGPLGKALDRIVVQGHRTTERVAGAVDHLADAAKVRIKNERLERTRSKRSAELGARVYELARAKTRYEGVPPQVLDDDQVKALLEELGLLDADRGNAASEFREPDRAGA